MASATKDGVISQESLVISLESLGLDPSLPAFPTEQVIVSTWQNNGPSIFYNNCINVFNIYKL